MDARVLLAPFGASTSRGVRHGLPLAGQFDGLYLVPQPVLVERHEDVSREQHLDLDRLGRLAEFVDERRCSTPGGDRRDRGRPDGANPVLVDDERNTVEIVGSDPQHAVLGGGEIAGDALDVLSVVPVLDLDDQPSSRLRVRVVERHADVGPAYPVGVRGGCGSLGGGAGGERGLLGDSGWFGAFGVFGVYGSCGVCGCFGVGGGSEPLNGDVFSTVTVAAGNRRARNVARNRGHPREATRAVSPESFKMLGRKTL
ncbi:hypothetical protein [Halomarina oriensis]|uniref:Uncharacterized protein n=1 Tax=Halomarina oriensis TaxID=671145 RepID=A0A6B0GF37_9EURY|nr:hypothetical protein [Halomarina oriensis]MWG33442.1 hypothetical protein [Halomarina oriensis]